MTTETCLAPTGLPLLLNGLWPGGWTLIVIVGLGFALNPYLSRRSFRSRLVHTQGCQAPTRFVHRDPLLGLDALQDSLQARRQDRYFRRQQRLHQAHGSTFMSLLLGSWVVNTIDPQNLEALFSTKFSDYEVGFRRRNAFAPLLGQSIFQSEGARWKTLRSQLQICFSKVQTSQLGLLEHHVQNLLTALSAVNDGQAFNLAPYFHRLAADISTDFLFGESINSLSDPKNLDGGALKAFKEALGVCELRWLLGSLSWLWPQPTFMKNVRIIHDFIQRYVDAASQHREVTTSSPSCKAPDQHDEQRILFIDQLRHRTQDPMALRYELTTLYFGGTDAPAALLINSFFVFSNRPDVWGRIRAEVQPLGGKPPSLQQLKQLKYVSNCIRECLRLYPPQPSNSRVALRDTVLPTGGGPDGDSPVLVPKGTMVHMSTYALHRRKDLWGEDADEFCPERWSYEKLSWKYIPFLGGPRNCVGMDFALNEASYAVVRMAQTFRSITSADSNEWVEGCGLALESKNGAQVVLSRDL